jgi:hypothetical protein
MYLTRSMLAEWKLSEAATDAVLEAHRASVERMRGEWEKELTQAQSLKDAASERDALQKEVERLKKETERADHAEAALSEYRLQQEAKVQKQLRAGLVSEALKKSGVSAKILPLLMTAVDTESVQIENGGLANEDDVIAGIRKQWPECFAVIRPEPAAGAHTAFGGMRISREEIGRMTTEEINDQWASVQEALRSW